MKKDMRRMMLLINPHIIESFCIEGTIVIEKSPIPKTAKWIGTNYDWERGCFAICFEDKSFKPVPYGHIIPQIDSSALICKRLKKKFKGGKS